MDKIEQLKEIIATSNSIVFFGGAGVSTESGIPDFRSENGLYQARLDYGSSPEELLSYSFFNRKTDVFFDYYKKNLIHRNAKPNKAHKALAKLERDGKLTAVVTQNIDGLHQLAGNQKVYELHGSVLRNTCMKCYKKFDLDYVMDQEGVPKCDQCGGTIKPDVILYEEMLDDSVMSGAIKAISAADTLIVGGTSLVVYPAAGLIRYFKGPNLILINKSETPYDSQASLVINDSIGDVLGKAVLKEDQEGEKTNFIQIDSDYYVDVEGMRVNFSRIQREYGNDRIAAMKHFVRFTGKGLKESKSIIQDGYQKLEEVGQLALKEGETDVALEEENRRMAELEKAIALEEQGILFCLECYSTSLSANKQGFRAGKAVVGQALLGSLGLLAGNIGANKVRNTCLKCGYEFWAGEK